MVKYPLLIYRKQLVAALFFIFVIGCIEIPRLSAQDETPLFTPFPTPEVDIWPFPIDAHCRDFVFGPGPTWRGITVGQSTIDELETLLAGYSAEYRKSDRGERGINFSLFYHREAIEKGIPIGVYVCVRDHVIVSLHVSDARDSLFYLDDWVAELGAPDTVTWGRSNFDRTVFWFEKGLAVSILTGEPFGVTGQIVYFPYQSVDGYESRWPFKRTAKHYIEGDEVFNPPLPTEQNPFDFDAMIATMTVEPTRTPTPTFTPQPTISETPTTP